jgi:hypothetical protein
LFFDGLDGRRTYVTGRQFFDRALKVWLEILASIASASFFSISSRPGTYSGNHVGLFDRVSGKNKNGRDTGATTPNQPHSEPNSDKKSLGSSAEEERREKAKASSAMDIEEEGKVEEEKDQGTTGASSNCNGFKPYDRNKEMDSWKLDFRTCDASFHDPRVFQFFEAYFFNHFPNAVKSSFLNSFFFRVFQFQKYFRLGHLRFGNQCILHQCPACVDHDSFCLEPKQREDFSKRA